MGFKAGILAIFVIIAGHIPLKAYAAQQVTAGNVDGFSHIEHHSYVTKIGLNLPRGKEEVYVYTPPGYDAKGSVRYPVLFLLHGFKQHAEWWQTVGNVQSVLDELISRGKARPMIVVMPESYGDYRFLEGGDPAWLSPRRVQGNINLFSQMLIKEILPRTQSRYRVSTDREDMAIAGLSMGGREAIAIGLSYPTEFAWIGGFSPAFLNLQRNRFVLPSPKSSDLRLIWIGYGTSDHIVGKATSQLINDLAANGFPVKWAISQGKHEDVVWLEDFRRFAPLLFQPSQSH